MLVTCLSVSDKTAGIDQVALFVTGSILGARVLGASVVICHECVLRYILSVIWLYVNVWVIFIGIIGQIC
jgi:hypothetical protein